MGRCYNRPMVYAVAILLISALTTVGLIATWAATSPGNWFWRTMAFLGAMSPLFLIPAYESFVAFVIQGAVVAAGNWFGFPLFAFQLANSPI